MHDFDSSIIEYLKAEKGLNDKQIEDFSREYATLTDAERSYVIYEVVGKALYKEYPVDIDTFIFDPYFLGNIYGDIIFPMWVDVLKEIYPAPFCKRYNEVLLSCATRCFGKGTKVRMFDGSVKNVEDIKVGEQVMGPDSKPRNVRALSHGVEEMYKVTPRRGGNSFTCNKNHVLALRKIRDHKYPNKYENLTVEEYFAKSQYQRDRYYRLYHSQAIQYPEKEYLIDPYIFGTWIGDGHTSCFRITTVDNEIKDAWKEFSSTLRGYYYRETLLPNKKTPTWDVSISRVKTNSCQRSEFLDYLRSITNEHKRIPQEYMTGSIEQRLQLLAGIIDTDGYKGSTSKNCNCYRSICTKYRDLAEDYANLARSLGFRATVHERNKKLSYAGKVYTSYDINLTGDFTIVPCRLKRKQTKDIRPVREWAISEFDIEPIGDGEFFGFEVDGDHLFLLEDYTVVHNSGKTTVAVISALYELYMLLCMISPSKTLNIKNNANICFIFLSKDNPTACSQLGEDMHKGLTQSPYFVDVITNNLSFSNLDKKGVQITNNILLKAGSSVNVITGTDLLFGVLDEANMPSPKIADERLVETRTKLYTAMVDRRNATFSKAPAQTGMMILCSSPMDEGDVIGERINLVKDNDVPNVFILDNIPRWEARNEHNDDTFDFFLGSNTQDPCIIEETDVDINELDENKIIHVPRTVEYLTQFRSNPRLAIQEIAGRRTVAENAFFNSVSVFKEVFAKDNDIFRRDDLKVPLDSMTAIEDYLYDRDYFSHPKDPDCFRYIHLDMAEKKDRFGIAAVYCKMVKYTSEDGEVIRQRKYYVDFCLGVSTNGKNAVDLLKVLEFIYGLKKKGYPVKKVSTDSHQGELARQILRRHGVTTEYQSLQKDKLAYLFLKNLIITKTLVGYKNPILTGELAGLREDNKYVQKSKSTTDDLSDALAGACYLASQDPFFESSNEHITELIESQQNMAGFVQDFNRAVQNVDFTKMDDINHMEQAGFYLPEGMNVLDVFNNTQGLKF